MRRASEHTPDAVELVGIVDPSLPALMPEDRALLADTVDIGAVSGRADIFVQPSPMTHPQTNLLSRFRRANITKATVIYDFIPYDEPTHYFRADADRVAYHAAMFCLPSYDLFFPISNYSAGRLVDLLGIDRKHVATIGAPIRDELIASTGTPTEPAFSSFADESLRYFLVVAGDDWRKNAACALAAFARLADVGLVIVGPYSDARQAAILGQLPSSLRGRVRFCNGLADAELAALYAGAIATICPSRIEGFSLPVVEALACNSPVLASDCAAQVELVPDADTLFSPDDSSRLALLMAELLRDPGRRAALLRRQRPMVPQFREAAVAAKFWPRIFAEQRRTAAPFTARGARPRLAFVTPYPPDASGVADYSARSLADIVRYADVDLFTDATDIQVQSGVRFAGPISSFPYFSRRYDDVVSVVGNSHFHVRIVDYLRDFGGACVSHDARMADFYLAFHGIETFSRMVEHRLGRTITRAEAEAGLLTPEIFGTLFFDEIVYSAAPFIVHSRGIQRRVEAIYGVAATYLPFCLQREFDDVELTEANRAVARRRLGIAPETIALVTFGMMAPSKGNIECIEALHRLRERHIDAQLYFVGEANSYAGQLAKVAQTLGVTSFVHFMRQRPLEAVFRDFLVGGDIAIQLRSHGLGGLSGALLDAVSAGMPAVASVDLAEAMEAPDYVRTVPVGAGAAPVIEQVAQIVGTGRYRFRTTSQRNEYNAAHSCTIYAQLFMAAIGLDV